MLRMKCRLRRSALTSTSFAG